MTNLLAQLTLPASDRRFPGEDGGRFKPRFSHFSFSSDVTGVRGSFEDALAVTGFADLANRSEVCPASMRFAGNKANNLHSEGKKIVLPGSVCEFQ